MNSPPDFATALFVLSGRLGLNEIEVAGDSELALFNRDGNEIVVDALKDSRFLLLSGEPINEPVAQYGSFVMNSEDELRRAMREFMSRQNVVSIAVPQVKPPPPPAKEPPPPARQVERLAYTLHEAAEMLGIDYFSVYRLVQLRKLRACRAMRRKILIPRTELLKLLKTE